MSSIAFHFISIKELEKRIQWLINLRWIAIVGVFLVILGSRELLNLRLHLFSLFLGNAILLGHNTVFHSYHRRLKNEKESSLWFRKANRFANLQISLDFLMLSYFIHFSGGIENPFIFYFIFHMVIASILLSNSAAYYQATLAVFLLGTVVFGEYLDLLPHYHLSGFLPEGFCLLNARYLPATFLIFTTTLYITVYMATSIVNQLRDQEVELERMNEKLKEQDLIKSQYVLTVSHDIQVSLSAIQSCLQVVLSNMTGSLSEKAREMIARSEQRSRHLLNFVKDLLDLSRMRAMKALEKERISLFDTVSKAVEQLRIKATEKKLHLEISMPRGTMVMANPGTLEHVFLNLLENAIRYTPQGGRIDIGVQSSREDGNFLISVKDTGIGIPETDLTQIFEDFYRAENAQVLEKNGTGLGLSIVKQIILTHGGRIWVESQIGKGSAFMFTLQKAN